MITRDPSTIDSVDGCDYCTTCGHCIDGLGICGWHCNITQALTLRLAQREPLVQEVIRLAAEFDELDADDHDTCIQEVFEAARKLAEWKP